MRNCRVYRNIRKGCWSIQQKVDGRWLVVDHADTLYAMGVTFKVSEAGRQRVLKQRRKAVHAYAMIDDLWTVDYADVPAAKAHLAQISYNPYRSGHFEADGLAVAGTSGARFDADGKIRCPRYRIEREAI